MIERLAFLAAIALAAAQPVSAAEPVSPLLALQEMDQRVAAIGHRIAMSGTAICPRTVRTAGFSIHVLDQYAPAARAAAVETFGLGDMPVVLTLAPGSAADRAGLKVGDRLASLNGRTLAAAPAVKAGYARVAAFEAALAEAMDAGPVAIVYERNGERKEAVLTPDTGCASRVQLIPSRRLNATADGTYAQLTTGIVDFTRNDDELALVVAHEMAHNILGHRAALDAQKVSRGLLKSIDGSAPKIKATEKEADYFALYLVARAGYDIAAAPAFWDRYGRKMGPSFLSDGTHPGRGARMDAAKAAIAEIQAKRAAGQPLAPDLSAAAD